MRVLMISKACLVGAYQRKLEEIAAYLDVELAVFVPPEWREPRGGTLRLERAYVRGYTLQALPMAFNGNFHLHFYPSLGRELDRFRPDVVHIDEEPYNLATFHATLLARRSGARALFFTWQNHHRHYPPPFNWMERCVYRWSAYGLAGNQEAVQVLRAKGYAGPLKLIPQFGVDPELFQPRRQRDAGQALSIGYVGRLVEEKGVALLLQAAAGLNGLWRLYILGSGPQREELHHLAHELGIAAQVIFDDPIPSTQMSAYYAGLDVLVLPSRTRPNWKEQFGRVLVEAMACGVPVIGSSCGEIPNVIGQAGRVFPEDDVLALREHLACLQRDEALWSELAQRGRQRVLQHYTQARIAAETVGVYRELRGDRHL
ncbi:MAG: glycosyltransferase family 4 protein [Thermoflexales bacterium]|nr:glycosyltransferase family 4 protein [Thermoflexales bacterium]